MLFEQDGVNRRELCRRFGISPTIGYRLWARYRQEGHAGLADRSRRPQRSPGAQLGGNGSHGLGRP
jgi:transposase